MGIVNACEKSTRQVDNEIYVNGLSSNQNIDRRVLKQQNLYQYQNKPLAPPAQNNKNNYFKQHQENIQPIQELSTEESKLSKSAYSKIIDKGLMESSSMKVLKIDQNETKLLNQMYTNNLMHSNSLIDCARNRSTQSQHVMGTNYEMKNHSNSFYNNNVHKITEPEGFRSSRPSLTSSNTNLTRSTYSASLHVINERKRVKEIYEDGSVYEGQVLNGLRDGQGTFTYSNQGAKYIGQWVKGSIEGYGILYFSNNKIAYEGKWMENKFNGNGVVYNENELHLNEVRPASYDFKSFDNIGDYWLKYDGNFVDDQKQGLGTMYLKNGEKFVGNFNKDVVDGNGAYYQLDGTIVLGVWSNNNLILETSRINC